MSARFPNLREVDEADHTQIVKWNRHLPRPEDDHDVGVLRAVRERFKEIPEEELTVISKEVGW